MESLWHDQVKLPQFPQLEQDISTEVLIIGGGLVGIYAPVFCSKRAWITCWWKPGAFAAA